MVQRSPRPSTLVLEYLYSEYSSTYVGERCSSNAYLQFNAAWLRQAGDGQRGSEQAVGEQAARAARVNCGREGGVPVNCFKGCARTREEKRVQ